MTRLHFGRLDYEPHTGRLSYQWPDGGVWTHQVDPAELLDLLLRMATSPIAATETERGIADVISLSLLDALNARPDRS
ncbi:hypothetical protein [Nocardioides sp.]|uniref:hypothetical protein n=1 Tax=Nocardioides sp. TaxID=35761 RepID=UPI003D115055